MSSASDLPSLRSIAGRQRRRSSVAHVEATTAAAQEPRRAAARQAAQESAEKEAEAAAQQAAQAIAEKEIEEAAYQLYRHHIETTPFRFLDLPRELQEVVYSIYTSKVETENNGSKSHPLCRLRLPALAQVNQQIRSDFLQTFFKESAFKLWIGPYWKASPHPNPIGTNDSLYRAIRASEDSLDPLFLRPHLAAAIPPDTVFQNVTFSIHQVTSRQELQLSLWRDRFLGQKQVVGGSRFAALELKWIDRKLVHDDLAREPRLLAQHDAKIPGRTVSFAEGIVAGRKEFKGFTVADLRRIAINMVTGFEDTKA